MYTSVVWVRLTRDATQEWYSGRLTRGAIITVAALQRPTGGWQSSIQRFEHFDPAKPFPADAICLTALAMSPRIPLAARRAACTPAVRFRVHFQRRCASSSPNAPEIYDVVCVGGGPAGLSLLAGLKSSPFTNGLKVALIEGQDLQKNRLQKDATLDSFSNRCSSLTPASMRNLQGTPSSIVLSVVTDPFICRNRRMATRKHFPRTALPGNAGVGRRIRCANIL